ncbi:MAG: hypothetical protein M3Q53_07225 [Actinomycetota bacterium]|nr:hypothetical protein [Actinomycetota bacterium]
MNRPVPGGEQRGESRLDRRAVLRATVTPLASIFGSGFLIIVPVLERTLGALAVVGTVAICALAWVIGTAIRHIVSEVEPRIADGSIDRTTQGIDRLADAVIVAAYVISVALYLRIMAEYIVGYLAEGSDFAERLIASAGVALIAAVGVTRGFRGLDLMERLALGGVLVLTTVLGGAFFIADAGDLLGVGIELPPVPSKDLAEVLLVLGGIVITVQGFETVRYIGDEFDARTRIWASRVAQLIATSIYIGFVAVATPLMGIGTDAGTDKTLIEITERVLPLLALPLVISAILSQFSAATADTVAAAGNLNGLFDRWMTSTRAYLLSGIAAIILAWTVDTLLIIAIASRAFAAYYCLQALIAMRTSTGLARRAGYGVLALVLAAITLLAQPAG